MISGFQRLRYLEALLITNNPKLITVDGLWGVREVTLGVTLVNNPILCYSLDSLSDIPFWQVKNWHVLYMESVIFPLIHRFEWLKVHLSA